jgi:GNAT superfamily N-acetyltransferase
MTDPILLLTDSPPESFETFLGESLNRFNTQITGEPHSRPLAVIVRDPQEDTVLGGLIGRTSLGLLFVDLIFVPDSLRGRGLGAKVMRCAEAEALKRGRTQAVLFTIAFQAPEFYRRLGYAEFGRVSSGQPEQARVFMTKALLAPEGPESGAAIIAS